MSPHMRPLAALLLLGVCLLLLPTAAFAGDFDGDGVPDETDNCTAVANPNQIDTDGDGFGNRCDSDFDQNGVVNFADLARLKQKFFQSDPLTDLNGDGVVNFADLAILKGSFFRVPGPKCASCPIDPCEQGRALLCPGLSIVAADAALEKCLATIDPVSRPQQFQTATFLRGITRVARPAFEGKPGPDPSRIDSLSEALDALGVGSSGRDPLDFMATLPVLPDRSCTVPEGVREADIESALQAELMPQLDAALAALPAVPAGWSDHCDVSRFGRTASVEIDGSDALLLRAHLHALRAALHLLAADRLDFDLGALCTGLREGPLPTIESFLRDHPRFGVRDEASPEAQAALLDLEKAIDLMNDALNAIRAETDPQGDDLAFIDANDPNGLTPDREAALRARIDYARASLRKAILVPPGLLHENSESFGLCGDPTLYLGALFDERWQLRALLPPFVGDDAAVDSLPDPTLGGLLPGQRSGDLRCVVDEKGPLISVAAGDPRSYPPPPFTSEPVHLSIRIQDPPVGASPGSAIDPASISVRLYPNPFGAAPPASGCRPRLGGVAVLEGSDVAQRFQMTTAPDGSVLLESNLDVTTTSPARGCDVAINVTAADAYGNGGHGSGALRIYEHGPVVTLSPQSYFGASPAQLSITVAAPFGDVSLDAIRIQAFGGYGCSSLRVNGQPLPFVAQPPFFWPTADVTRLLSRVEGPGVGARTWSGLVSAGASAGGCSVSFGPSDPVFGFLYDTAYFWITP